MSRSDEITTSQEIDTDERLDSYLASNDSNLGDSGLSISIQKLGSMTDDTSVLLRRTLEKWATMQCHGDELKLSGREDMARYNLAGILERQRARRLGC